MRAGVAGLRHLHCREFSMPSARPSTADKRKTFRELHKSGCFVIPNPWNVGSARYLQGLGFKAIATTSSGYAHSQGYADGAQSRDEVLSHFKEIAAAADIPLNADFENGFADDPDTVAENVTRCIATGVAGLSIEDSPQHGQFPLYDIWGEMREARRLWGAHATRLIGLMTTSYATGQIAGPLVATTLVECTNGFGVSPGIAAAATDPAHGDHAHVGVIRAQREFGKQSYLGAFASSRDFADIDDLGMHLAAVALELLGGRVGLLLAGAPDADIGAGLGHRVGHAEADAAIAAGHQRHLARQIEALVGHVHSLPFISSPPIGGEENEQEELGRRGQFNYA